MYGVVEINGQQYLERWQVIPAEFTFNQNNQTIRMIVSLPGLYDFRLKALTRDILDAANKSDFINYRFAIRIGNTDGDIRYSQGGVGSSTDQVIDTCLFGTGMFPYPVVPPIFYGKNSGIVLEMTDLTGNAAAANFTPKFGFHGAYLIPTSTGQ
jgi:hypothetical protein